MSYLLPRRRGPHPAIPFLLAAAGCAIGLVAAFLLFAPRITAVAPAAGGRTGMYAAVEIQFSVPMDAECTADHFKVDPAVEGELTVEGGTLRFRPNDPWPSGSDVRVNLRAGACSRRGLPLLAGLSWTFTPSLVRVAYIPFEDAGGRLMGISADGGDPELLAWIPDPVQDFDVSRRGDFAVLSTGAYNRPGKLWLSRLDGEASELLLDCGADYCGDPVISPDGSFLAYVRKSTGANPDQPAHSLEPFIELLTIAGGQTRTVSPPGNVAGNPSWSAQGWLSYYDGMQKAIIIDDLSGGQTVIPNNNGAAWAWLPDGSAIIFPEIRIAEGEENEVSSPRLLSYLFRVEVQTNKRENLSGEDLLEDASPAVSPDGRRLAFSRNFFDDRWTPGKQLWIMELKDGSLRQMSQAPEYSHSSIQWSPDGSWLVFMLFHETRPEDPPEIWCLNADGSDPRRLVAGGFLPKWLA